MTLSQLKKNDTVLVLAGKDRGKKAKILRVQPLINKAVVEGLNMVSRHQKPKSAQKPGEIIKKETPLSISNLQLVCPQCHKPTRIGTEVDQSGARTRVCKKCTKSLDK